MLPRTQKIVLFGAPFEPESLALFARFTTPPTTARKISINNAIKALKIAGIWAKLDALYVLAAADAQAAQRNWIADAYNLVPTNSPTFTADLGYAGDGATSYLETGFNPTTATSPKFTLNDASLGVSVSVDVSQDAGDIGNTNAYIRANRAATLFTGNRTNTTSTVNGAPVVNGLGLAGWSRFDASAVSYYKNGAVGASESRASVALSNDTIRIGSAINFSSRTLSLGCFGAALSDAQWAALYAAFA